jgi:hypothetical protein
MLLKGENSIKNTNGAWQWRVNADYVQDGLATMTFTRKSSGH